MEKEYHEIGKTITLSDKTKLQVVKREGPSCGVCYYFKQTDCSDRLCNFNERPDKEDIIFLRHE